MYQKLAGATVQIICGNSAGSGFHFLNEELIVTNHHVIEPHFQGNLPIIAVHDDGSNIQLQLLGYSPKEEHDFALLRLKNKFTREPIILQPKELTSFQRGTEIAFAGFPHGISDLLVHKAIISAPISNRGF